MLARVGEVKDAEWPCYDWVRQRTNRGRADDEDTGKQQGAAHAHTLVIWLLLECFSGVQVEGSVQRHRKAGICANLSPTHAAQFARGPAILHHGSD